jgi:hypothetical protein
MAEFIGECYINGEEGVMDGQAADEAVFAGKYPIVDYKLK